MWLLLSHETFKLNLFSRSTTDFFHFWLIWLGRHSTSRIWSFFACEYSNNLNSINHTVGKLKVTLCSTFNINKKCRPYFFFWVVIHSGLMNHSSSDRFRPTDPCSIHEQASSPSFREKLEVVTSVRGCQKVARGTGGKTRSEKRLICELDGKMRRRRASLTGDRWPLVVDRWDARAGDERWTEGTRHRMRSFLRRSWSD